MAEQTVTKFLVHMLLERGFHMKGDTAPLGEKNTADVILTSLFKKNKRTSSSYTQLKKLVDMLEHFARTQLLGKY